MTNFDNPRHIVIMSELEVCQMAYAVLPPGHGKSYYHKKYEYMYEADTVFNCRGTQELEVLRAKAKETGDWKECDITWTRELLARLPKTRCVVLVPDDAVGELLGAELIFRGVLTDSQWSENLSRRKGDIVKYSDWRANVLRAGANEYATNFDLESALVKACECWIKA